jgi:hypothetical protein
MIAFPIQSKRRCLSRHVESSAGESPARYAELPDPAGPIASNQPIASGVERDPQFFLLVIAQETDAPGSHAQPAEMFSTRSSGQPATFHAVPVCVRAAPRLPNCPPRTTQLLHHASVADWPIAAELHYTWTELWQ